MTLAAGPVRAQAADPCAEPANWIIAENCKPGNPSTEWDINGAGDTTLQGFATDISYNFGETARFKIDTDSADYRIDIYRMGYYGGNGARRVPAPQGFLGHLIAREFSQEECRDGEARSGIGGGGSP